MTTPNQPAPDGAYIVDSGGGEFNYGQGLNDQSAANLMVGGFPSISLLDPIGAVEGIVSLVTNTLLSIPLEVLQLFENLIPGDLGDAFATVTGAVGAIVDNLISIGPMMGSVAFSLLETSIRQVLDIFNGLVVTPISSAVQGVMDWWNLITGQTATNASNNASIIDALVSGLTGSASTGNDPGAILLALINQGLAIPANLLGFLGSLFGQQASTQAQLNALQNGGFSHDFAANGVTGWTNLVGTLALSTRGAFIQAHTQTVAYRALGASQDKFGVNIALDMSMQGIVRIGICSNTTGTSWVGLEIYRGFDGDAIRIVAGSSPTLAIPIKQVDFLGTNRLNGPISIDLKTDGVNKFTVSLNTQPVSGLDFTDTTGLATHDASHRNIILTSNGDDRDEDSYYGPVIKKVVSYVW